MKEIYRKLTKPEIEKLFGPIKSLNVDKYYKVVNAVKEYYGSAFISKIILNMNSEYHDDNYENRVVYVGVYDEGGNELLPDKSKASEWRKSWYDLEVYREERGCGYHNESGEPLDDIVINLSDELPELYIKE
jgi:hypothetical protein